MRADYKVLYYSLLFYTTCSILFCSLSSVLFCSVLFCSDNLRIEFSVYGSRNQWEKIPLITGAVYILWSYTHFILSNPMLTYFILSHYISVSALPSTALTPHTCTPVSHTCTHSSHTSTPLSFKNTDTDINT